MNFIQKRMNKKGFTLVELIIVIAVMAILAAIVIPRMTGITDSFKAKADEKVCENYARELEIRAQLGNLTPNFGVITEAGAAESDAADEFYYVHDGANITVFVATSAPADHAAAVTAAGSATIKNTRTNATEIE